MARLEGIRRRLFVLFRGVDVRRAVEDEIRFHLDMTTQELVERGWSEPAARREARRRFGDVGRFRHQSRLIGERMLRRRLRRDAVRDRLQDFRFALRVLGRAPSFALVSILTLGLGIGATTAVFSVVHGVLLQPLPYPDPDRLVRIRATYTDDPAARGNVSEMDFLDFRDGTTTLESMAAFNWTGGGLTLNEGNTAARLTMVRTTHDYFQVLGVKPLIGRTYTAEEDQEGAEPVLVLGHGAWQRYFGSDPDIVGRRIRVSGTATRQVIGVLPPDFRHPEIITPPEVWIPLAINPADDNRGAHYLRSIGRLKPGVSIAEANAELMQISEALEARYPESNMDYRATVEGLHQVSVGDTGASLWLLLGAVGVLLLIAGSNVASLCLARAAARSREFALRRALGGSRSRLLALLLTESVTLSLGGGLLGVGLAFGLTRLFLTLAAGSVPFADNVELNSTVLLFSVALMVGTGMLFGLVPALEASRSRLQPALREGDRGSSAGQRHRRIRSRLVVAETALAVVLVIGGGLLLKNFLRLQQLDLGVETERIVSARVSLAGASYAEPRDLSTFYEELITRMENQPGVLSAAVVDYLPLATGRSQDGFRRDDRPAPPPGQGLAAEFRRVSEDYFRTMGIELISGRLLRAGDDLDGPRVTIIDAESARRNWPGEDPLGKTITAHGESWTIVGIVESIRHFGPLQDPVPTHYISHQQEPMNWLTLVTRTALGPDETAAAMRRHVREMDPLLAVFGVRTLAELASQSLAQPRFQTALVAIFSIAALLLAATGVYGLTTYTVSQRTQEIGVRVALGAASGDIHRMVVVGALRLTAIGVLLGLAAYLPLRSLMQGMLAGTSTVDPVILAGVVGLLFVISASASYLPSRRAANLDPTTSLRVD